MGEKVEIMVVIIIAAYLLATVIAFIIMYCASVFVNDFTLA